MSRKIPVILDTDIGGDIDDTWALAMMLRCPELDIKLVVSDTGNTTYRAKIIAKILHIAGRTDIAVGIGI
jgi:inosine-uridine nucleoside N-ribohydrolase